CVSCHTMHGNGGISGPDLSQLGTRFSQEDILASIIDPSKVISDQYASTILSLKNGQSMVGNIIDENEQSYRVSQNPFAPDEVREVSKDEVTDKKLSNVSAMPPGLINRLNEDELKDLLAFLVSGGNPDHSIYDSE
ncbi:MAG: c-type cytochrome, partial [Cyclobacteriaceae bacterium]|nr:c-type cytochrome [Cyclobacteriaceae bacterium]